MQDGALISADLEAGNMEGVRERLRKRAEGIMERGGDPRHTVDAFSGLVSGEPGARERLQAELDQIAALGERFGITSPGRQQPKYTNIRRLEGGGVAGLNPDTGQYERIESGDLEFEQTTTIDDLNRIILEDRIARDRRADAVAEEDREREQEEREQTAATATRRAEDLLDLTRGLLADDDALEAYSGYSGRNFTIRPTQVSWEADLDRLLNELTLENTPRLKGAMSEGELDLLRSAAASIVEGGATEANRDELRRILNTLEGALGQSETDFNRPEPTPQQGSTRARTRRERQQGTNRPLGNMSDEDLLNF